MANFALNTKAISTMTKIPVQNTPITVLNIGEQDYSSLTDMATAKDGDSRAADVIKNERTGAIGLVVKKGRYGGTYAHKDIAFEFGSAISVPFKLNQIAIHQMSVLESGDNDRKLLK